MQYQREREKGDMRAATDLIGPGNIYDVPACQGLAGERGISLKLGWCFKNIWLNYDLLKRR